MFLRGYLFYISVRLKPGMNLAYLPPHNNRGIPELRSGEKPSCGTKSCCFKGSFLLTSKKSNEGCEVQSSNVSIGNHTVFSYTPSEITPEGVYKSC